MPKIADTLIVLFTRGMSLREWSLSGMLSRELALYRRLAERYGRIVFVTYGDTAERSYLIGCVTEAEASKMIVCGNDQRMPIDAYEASLLARLRTLLGTDRTVVMKSNQMSCYAGTPALADALAENGRRVALIARGGYLWSRLAAHTRGPDSPEAIDAAEREASLCRSASLVVGTTEAMVKDLCWRYTLKPEAARVIPNYVDLAEPPRGAESRDRNLVLYAGQLAPVKRVDLLIEAMAVIKGSMGDGPVLEIIGAGPERKRLEDLAAAIEAPVRFVDRMPHEALIRRMGECAVYVQASETEGHPKTVIEAMATGAPVVVADSPGLGDVVSHGSTGLRVAGEPRAFAHAIESLLGDADWRELLGSAASTGARAQYGLDRILTLEIEAHQTAIARAAVTERAAA